VQTDEEGDKIHADDRALVKQNIVGLMLKSPEQIQKQVPTYRTHVLHTSVLYTDQSSVCVCVHVSSLCVYNMWL